jgi:HptB-dependent secretion and biofilm anti anti-sigma factor
MEHKLVNNGDTLELSLKGKFTFADNKAFSEVLDDVANNNYKHFTINLDGVEFIDSAALGILLLARDKCVKTATNLLLKNPKGQVKQMFDISRFNDLFQIEHA